MAENELELAARKTSAIAGVGHGGVWDGGLATITVSVGGWHFVPFKIAEELVLGITLLKTGEGEANFLNLRVVEVSFQPVGDEQPEVSPTAIRSAQIGKVIEAAKAAVVRNERDPVVDGTRLRFTHDGETAEFDEWDIENLTKIWKVSERGRKRVTTDWDVIAAAYGAVKLQGVKHPAKFLAALLETTPAVMSNRFAKAKKLSSLSFLFD